MFDYRSFALRKLRSLGTRYLPFADIATERVPIARLLRLSLFQVTVGMALVLLVGTLNRVMIVELSVPASLVAGMLALPLVFAPLRTLIGHRSDMNVSALGLRRIPFIWKGTLYQFGGFAIMPFALLVLSGYGEAGDAPRWIGYAAAALAFLLVGAGLHMVQTVGLALATDLVRTADQPKVVGLMYVMLLLGMLVSALVFGALLADYSPGRLIQVIQGAALLTVVLNLLAMWKQEVRDRARAQAMKTQAPVAFSEAWGRLARAPGMMRLLVVIGLGTFGFGMADVLLEPYGGQALGLSVGDTTRLTALFSFGALAGFATAAQVLGRGAAPARMGLIGAAIGIPGFAAIVVSSLGGGIALFLLGVLLTGIGTGLFGHATLTATIRAAPAGRTGLSLGAWGAVQASAAGIGVALAGIVRDVLVGWRGEGMDPHMPYTSVFMIEILFLAMAVVVIVPLLKGAGRDRQDIETDTNMTKSQATPVEVP